MSGPTRKLRFSPPEKEKLRCLNRVWTQSMLASWGSASLNVTGYSLMVGSYLSQLSLVVMVAAYYTEDSAVDK